MTKEQATEAGDTKAKETTKEKKETEVSKLTKDQFFEHLDGLTVLELADYIKEFEDRYGVSAAAAAAPAAVAPAGVVRSSGGCLRPG